MKYLIYKNKYLLLKNQYGGMNKLNNDNISLPLFYKLLYNNKIMKK
jgi:hypothetical protein